MFLLFGKSPTKDGGHSSLLVAQVRTLGWSIHYLTENRDVIHMVVVRQGSHEAVAETGLADAHGSLLPLPS